MKSWLAFAIGGLLAALIVAAILTKKYGDGEKTVATVTLPEPPAEELPPPVEPPEDLPQPPPYNPPVNPNPRPRPMSPPPPSGTAQPPQGAYDPTPPPPPPAINPTPPQPLPPPPPPPRVARTVTIPSGTVVNVRVVERVSTETHKAGETFAVTFDQPLVVDGLVIAERGARGVVEVIQSERAGRVKNVSHLAVRLISFTSSDGQRIDVEGAPFVKEGEKDTKKDAAKVGIGAAVGAAIGAIAGGGKGAAIGAGAGAGAGTGAVLATRGPDTVLAVEDRLPLAIAAPAKVTERIN